MGKARILGRDLELELLEVCSFRVPGRSRACESLRSLKEQPVSKSLEGRQANFLVSVRGRGMSLAPQRRDAMQTAFCPG